MLWCDVRFRTTVQIYNNIELANAHTHSHWTQRDREGCSWLLYSFLQILSRSVSFSSLFFYWFSIIVIWACVPVCLCVSVCVRVCEYARVYLSRVLSLGISTEAIMMILINEMKSEMGWAIELRWRWAIDALCDDDNDDDDAIITMCQIHTRLAFVVTSLVFIIISTLWFQFFGPSLQGIDNTMKIQIRLQCCAYACVVLHAYF